MPTLRECPRRRQGRSATRREALHLPAGPFGLLFRAQSGLGLSVTVLHFGLESAGGRGTALLLILAFMVAGLAACTPPPPVESRLIWPSRVVTEAGSTFYVRGLRLAGTDQALKLQGGGANFWLPLPQISVLQLAGPMQGHYRRGRIWLKNGSRLEALVFAETLIQGDTDLGYWNLPLSRVQLLELGED